MAAVGAGEYVYFLYSKEHIDKRNEVEATLGRRFVCGTVVANMKRKKFSYMGTSTSNFMKQYPDAKIIAQGIKTNFTYENPSVVNKKGN